MKDWLEKKEAEQKNLFKNLIKMSVKTLKEFNLEQEQNLSVRVIFDKEEWINGDAVIQFLKENKDGDYDIKSQYRHSVYNTNDEISSKSELFKLREKGLFTNNWFAVLDSSRMYDTTFVLTSKCCILENEACEDRENRMKTTHTGFNSSITAPKKKFS